MKAASFPRTRPFPPRPLPVCRTVSARRTGSQTGNTSAGTPLARCPCCMMGGGAPVEAGNESLLFVSLAVCRLFPSLSAAGVMPAFQQNRSLIASSLPLHPSRHGRLRTQNYIYILYFLNLRFVFPMGISPMGNSGRFPQGKVFDSKKLFLLCSPDAGGIRTVVLWISSQTL